MIMASCHKHFDEYLAKQGALHWVDLEENNTRRRSFFRAVGARHTSRRSTVALVAFDVIAPSPVPALGACDWRETPLIWTRQAARKNQLCSWTKNTVPNSGQCFEKSWNWNYFECRCLKYTSWCLFFPFAKLQMFSWNNSPIDGLT